MARVRAVARAELPASLQGLFDQIEDYGPFANQVAAFAHRPPILRHLYGMLLELREQALLPPRIVELAVVAVSKLNACDYCIAHHAPVLQVEGISAAGVERLLDHEDHPELDAIDRLVVAYAIQVTTGPGRVPESLVADLRTHFSEPQLVELTWRIALCGAFNRFNDALELAIEPEVDEVLAR